MNQVRNKHRPPRTVWFGLFFLMLTGFLIAGYAVQLGAGNGEASTESKGQKEEQKS